MCEKKRKLIFALLAALAAALAVAGLLYLKSADVFGRSILPPCLFHTFTGLYCAGCGMTRALHYIVNGELYQGLRMNPLAVLAGPFLVCITLFVLYRAFMKRPMPRIPAWAAWAALAVIVLYTVARNLPWPPFNWLAPTWVS